MRDNLSNGYEEDCVFIYLFFFFSNRLVTLFTACSTAPIALYIMKFLIAIRHGVNLTQVSTDDNQKTHICLISTIRSVPYDKCWTGIPPPLVKECALVSKSYFLVGKYAVAAMVSLQIFTNMYCHVYSIKGRLCQRLSTAWV